MNRRPPADMLGGIFIGIFVLILLFAFGEKCDHPRYGNLEHILANAPK